MADLAPDDDYDALEDIPSPRHTMALKGHEASEKIFLDAVQSGKLHHAWLLTGPKGIGKATFAYRVARFLLSGGEAEQGMFDDLSLDVDQDHPSVHKISAGAHPNILKLSRRYDPERKRFTTTIPVDDVRKTVGFFGSTAGEAGWRICLVDAADDMNAAAANALLKILEEPPKQSIFLITSHAPGRLLPTIRSRCRRLPFSSLDDDTLKSILADLGALDGEDDDHIAEAIAAADGSVRKAILFLKNNGPALAQSLSVIMRALPNPPIDAVHRLGDLVSARGAEESYAILIDLILHRLSHMVHAGSSDQPVSALASWAGVWEKTTRSVAQAEALNLDKKAVILGIIRDFQDASRSLSSA
ncbi:DNA polymerase III subunit delta' [Coralliovum pocilloporae]|uniref:DNA polymerase III subunit delta' n=1 Tax=Coralliovum pocilloporae TaxID=3066369 RepID=UPI0033075891